MVLGSGIVVTAVISHHNKNLSMGPARCDGEIISFLERQFFARFSEI